MDQRIRQSFRLIPLVGLLLAGGLLAAAEEVVAKAEARNAYPLGAKGTIEGTVLANDTAKGRIIVKTEDGNLLFTPNWRGGASGGLDPAMLKRLKEYSPGDHVRIAWSWEDRRRVEEISKLGGAAKHEEGAKPVRHEEK